MNFCITHFHACNCRELKISDLRKSAIDVAIELDHTKNDAGLNDEERLKITRIVERVFLACEALDLTGIRQT